MWTDCLKIEMVLKWKDSDDWKNFVERNVDWLMKLFCKVKWIGQWLLFAEGYDIFWGINCRVKLFLFKFEHRKNCQDRDWEILINCHCW